MESFQKDVTELNRHDREILSKYTRLYSNFIESNTAKPDFPKKEEPRDKKMKLH